MCKSSWCSTYNHINGLHIGWFWKFSLVAAVGSDYKTCQEWRNHKIITVFTSFLYFSTCDWDLGVSASWLIIWTKLFILLITWGANYWNIDLTWEWSYLGSYHGSYLRCPKESYLVSPKESYLGNPKKAENDPKKSPSTAYGSPESSQKRLNVSTELCVNNFNCLVKHNPQFGVVEIALVKFVKRVCEITVCLARPFAIEL